MDNTSRELVQAGEAMTSSFSKIWMKGELQSTCSQSLVVIIFQNFKRKTKLQLCQKHRSISLISYPRKIIMKIITLTTYRWHHCRKASWFSEREGAPQNKYSVSETYARNTRSISRSSKTSKRPSTDRVWHEALWATMKKYSINASIIQVTVSLKICMARPKMLFNDSTGGWFS